MDGISLEIDEGETFGLVGESGCGKSTAGRVLARLYEPSGGEVIFNGKNIHDANGEEAQVLNRKMQMIFQDPQASLNPRMIVGDIIAEGIDIHNLAASSKERLDRVHELLETVGLNKEHANRYPHEFSGGQRQRIGIAEPKLLCLAGLRVLLSASAHATGKIRQRAIDSLYRFTFHGHADRARARVADARISERRAGPGQQRRSGLRTPCGKSRRRRKEHGATVVVEPVNHLQCGFHNTLDAVLNLTERIGSKQLKPMLDSFHMNIEETSMTEPILRAGKNLAPHFHLCESNGGFLGSGHLNLRPILETLIRLIMQDTSPSKCVGAPGRLLQKTRCNISGHTGSS